MGPDNAVLPAIEANPGDNADAVAIGQERTLKPAFGGTQVANRKGGGVGKNTAAYWLARLFKPVNDRGTESPHYSMRVQFKGERLTFPLGTSNKNAAAAKAAGVYVDLITIGVEATIAKHRPQADQADGILTIGQWIAATRKVSAANEATFNCYACSLRKIAGDILTVERSKTRFGGRKGGAAAYRATIEGASLEVLTPTAIQQWRLEYVRRAKNPKEERSRMTSCNSTIRQARSLFAGKILKFLPSAQLPKPAPFDGVEFFPKQSAKYFSQIDPKKLLQKAHADLSQADAPAFLVILLALSAGLRRGEIDYLSWPQVDEGRHLIRMESTEAGGLKTADSRAEVHIDAQVAKILKAFRKSATGNFVIEASGEESGPKRWGRQYRAEAVFDRVNAWLRKNGVKARKPLHELRKELGALVTEEHGIYAASRALRHSTVATTAAHYSDLKTRPVVNVGSWIAREKKPGKRGGAKK
jgi:integrase